jgi:hypothetical protein
MFPDLVGDPTPFHLLKNGRRRRYLCYKRAFMLPYQPEDDLVVIYRGWALEGNDSYPFIQEQTGPDQ